MHCVCDGVAPSFLARSAGIAAAEDGVHEREGLAGNQSMGSFGFAIDRSCT